MDAKIYVGWFNMNSEQKKCIEIHQKNVFKSSRNKKNFTTLQSSMPVQQPTLETPRESFPCSERQKKRWLQKWWLWGQQTFVKRPPRGKRPADLIVWKQIRVTHHWCWKRLENRHQIHTNANFQHFFAKKKTFLFGKRKRTPWAFLGVKKWMDFCWDNNG